MKLPGKRIILALFIGLLLGVFWLLAARVVMQKNHAVHHHANFALYINGERDMFDNFTFYEEVQSCGGNETDNPKTRVHMHDKVNYVVHVHDDAATWGQFFANLDYVLGNDLIKTDKGVFIDKQDGQRLRFMLNGQEVSGIANRSIHSEDALLIDYGSSTEQELQTRYDAIIRDASEYNKRQDPSSCTGGKPLTFSERLKRAVDFTR